MYTHKVSVIIVSYNVRYFLELCLHSVQRALDGINGEIIVVDNHSSDDSCAAVRERFPGVKLIANGENTGFARANNQGLEVAGGEYIHYLNPDTVLPEDFYRLSLDFMDAHPDAGSSGPRIIDGRGQYSPDSKKMFPSFWPSVFKVSGLSRFFLKSPFWNRYYAAQVAEKETAAVDILSGCCLLVRHSAMMQSGGSFDESYFMYCEDFDLCHRLQLSGFRNYYFPETTIIHYKGESTRKLTFRYVRIFNDALALFVKKYYPRRLGNAYILMLKVVMALRTVINWLRHIFSLFKLFIVDALVLSGLMWLMREFWIENVKPDVQLDFETFLVTTPLFVLTWLVCLFLNGAYDRPFSLFRAGRGMVLGTVIVLACYGLMPVAYRYSRGVILFTGITGTATLLVVRWLLSLAGIIKLVPRGNSDFRAAIVGTEEEYRRTKGILKKIRYVREVVGRVATDKSLLPADIGHEAEVVLLQKIFRINELIFNSGSMSYKNIMADMELVGRRSFYKIHLPQGDFIVGSNSAQSNSDEYLTLQKKYTIDSAAARRNKRILDISSSLGLLLLAPLTLLLPKGGEILRHSPAVLRGKKTWTGYDSSLDELAHLPSLKPALLPPYIIAKGYQPAGNGYRLLAERYASEYSAMDDLRLLLGNLKKLGEKV